ncbi:oxidoreductase [Streptomyces sp. SID6673]|nr:oxidoreductase [Streptomyces sp. SID11726]NEB26081.1 oxidoreductase [Streptomyces sp. SID6673]
MVQEAHPAHVVRVRTKEVVADGVVVLTLEHPDGRRLPDWTPGAHIDVMLPGGLTRQYSLCGDRWDAHTYRVAIRRDRGGSGGSAYIHDTLQVGEHVQIGGPRNNFAMAPASSYLFVAGGIGITPIVPMIVQAEMVGAAWHLLYLGRSRSAMPFLDAVAAHPEHVTVSARDEGARLDVTGQLGTLEPDTQVYACGPRTLLDDLTASTSHWPPGRLRVERFSAAPVTPARTAPFELHLARSRRTVTVRPERSVLDTLCDVGITVLSSCREGLCGTCETTVLAGEPDHRDCLLDDDERAVGDCMFVCVSRSRSDRLVLDL